MGSAGVLFPSLQPRWLHCARSSSFQAIFIFNWMGMSWPKSVQTQDPRNSTINIFCKDRWREIWSKNVVLQVKRRGYSVFSVRSDSKSVERQYRHPRLHARRIFQTPAGLCSWTLFWFFSSDRLFNERRAGKHANKTASSWVLIENVRSVLPFHFPWHFSCVT